MRLDVFGASVSFFVAALAVGAPEIITGDLSIYLILYLNMYLIMYLILYLFIYQSI
jgi:hypothetical protein